ncbi:MAG: Uncharacterized protein FD152_4 [Xanthobacteraceae bacterium]|nr:MAG: Uncharacterized protein FD152_4 [Xanthobacteraceae bacterium]
MKSPLEAQSRLVWLSCLAGFALVALNAMRAWPQISDLLVNADGDDQMRLVQVRDWLAGQGWFDVRQYRVLPPEGISMHWSRYLDAGIAGVLTVAGWALAQTQAELAAVILWPSLLACLMVLILAHGTSRLMGGAAAIGALAVFLSWGKLGGEFVAPRIDHHNAQILFASAVFYLALIPGRARVLGALAGCATALALAIGLEMLPALAAIWGLMALRHAFDEPQTGDWLIGFGVAIIVSASLLMAGQTAPSAWGVLYCDVLAPPIMALGAVGVVAPLVPVLAGRWLKGPAARILTLVILTGLGLWLAWPVLGHCLAGPYSEVAPEVRQIIAQNVSEARSASLLWSEDRELLGRVLGPPILIGLMALAVAWQLRGRLERAQSIGLLQAFLVFAAGLAVALVQIRATNLMTPAVPLLGGFLVHAFTRIPRASVLRVPAVIALVLALPTTVELAASWLLLPPPAAPPADVSTLAVGPQTNCRSIPAMAEVASLPDSILFTTLNLGPTILAYTPHSVTSAGYHRNPDAFWNGVGAFGTETALREALARSRADYVVLCAGGTLEGTSRLLRAILSGKSPAWLKDVTGDRQLVRVFQVDRSTLVAEGAAP